MDRSSLWHRHTPEREVSLFDPAMAGYVPPHQARPSDRNAMTIIEDAKTLQVPNVDDWVSASALRNFLLGDPLLDWLDLHGESHGFERDREDKRTDFISFITHKGLRFEQAVVEHIAGLAVGVRQILSEDVSSEQRNSDVAAEETIQAMTERVPVIAQGSLRHAESRTFGFPDLLIRSDVAHQLFPDALTADAAATPAPAIGLGDCHYVVVDTKFTTLHLTAGGELGNSGSAPAYKAQLFVYNRALGTLQGYRPTHAYLLGRGWEQTVKGDKTRGGNCMDWLAPVDHNENSRKGALSDLVHSASSWVRRVRAEGHEWEVLPEPTVDELRPDAKGDPGEWKSAVAQIVEAGEDLTRLWQVGVGKRNDTNQAGITRWTDPAVTPESVGVAGRTTAPRLQALLDVNRGVGAPVQPPHVRAARMEWGEPDLLEFYVDFETVSDLDDDFSSLPVRGGQPLIFMIGCGHVENDEWLFECFVADELNEPAEAVMLEAWHEHMDHIRERLSPGGTPKIIHWSSHETASLGSAFNAATARHSDKSAQWPRFRWFDFLSQVVRPEPVVVRGAHGFGLKAITNALHSLGCVDVAWGSGPADGLGAMVGAWWCQRQVDRGKAERLIDVDLMKEILDYNTVDCRAMMEIVRYLRDNH